MASHWYVPPPPGEATPLDPRIELLLDRTLDELVRKPDMKVVIASAKAWSREVWFTKDGEEFYFRVNGADIPDQTLPPSSRDEVIVAAQEQYRRLLRNIRLYERFLEPKIQQILASAFSKPEKIDRIYWLRIRYPAHVGCRVPVVFDGRIEEFCWGWEFSQRQDGVIPPKSRRRSDRLINRLFAETCILWSY